MLVPIPNPTWRCITDDIHAFTATYDEEIIKKLYLKKGGGELGKKYWGWPFWLWELEPPLMAG
jgi:hypothetical protein